DPDLDGPVRRGAPLVLEEAARVGHGWLPYPVGRTRTGGGGELQGIRDALGPRDHGTRPDGTDEHVPAVMNYAPRSSGSHPRPRQPARHGGDRTSEPFARDRIRGYSGPSCATGARG